MLVAACALLVLGLMVLVIGLRGRRVGVEPRCRGCGFDLRGLAVGAGRACPECGRVLDSQNAMVADAADGRAAGVSSAGAEGGAEVIRIVIESRARTAHGRVAPVADAWEDVSAMEADACRSPNVKRATSSGC